MPRGRPKKKQPEPMTVTDIYELQKKIHGEITSIISSVEQTRAKEKELFNALSADQQKAIRTTKEALSEFCSVWSEDFDLYHVKTPRALLKAYNLLLEHFDTEERD